MRCIAFSTFVLLLSVFPSTLFAQSNKNIRIPVLCYHQVKPDYKNSMNMPPQDFERQLKYLKDNGYTSILSADIERVLASTTPIKPVIITFDDNRKSVIQHAFPLMKKYGFRGIIFAIASGYTITNISTKFMSKDDIRKLLANGWELGSHTMFHPLLDKQTIEQKELELRKSKAVLSKAFNQPVDACAYPYGIYDDDVLKLMPTYYRYGYTLFEGNNQDLRKDTMFTINRHLMSQMSIQRFAQLLESSDLPFTATAVATSSKTCTVTVTLPATQKLTNLKLSWNYITEKKYTLTGNTITFTAHYRPINYCMVSITEPSQKDAQLGRLYTGMQRVRVK
jgi:peptidoglycan/xylan/chitin deacetylase (PgdA/CDA1 family)